MPDSVLQIALITVLGSTVYYEIVGKPSLSAEPQPPKWGFSVLSMFGGLWWYRINFPVNKLLYDVT